MIRPFWAVFSSPEAFPCSLFEYETHESHWSFYYCLIAWSSMCLADIFLRIDSSGAGLKESLWQKRERRRKEKIACPFFYLFFPFCFSCLRLSISILHGKSARLYKAWYVWNCLFPHRRSRANSTVKRYLKEIQRQDCVSMKIFPED